MEKRKKFLSVLLSAVMAVGMVPAGNMQTVSAETAAITAETIANGLEILNPDNILGNITLPTTDVEGASIVWESSNDEVVSDESVVNESYDDMPAGVVKRGEHDQQVVMTATVTYNGATAKKDIVLNVKAAPEQKSFAGYLFSYFPSNDNERIYYALSKDGMNFTDINDEEAIMWSTAGTEGLRDPYLIRSNEGDRFWMIGTDLAIGTTTANGYKSSWGTAQYSGSLSLVVWESTDLVHWSDARLVDTGIRDVGCVWAPEAIYDEKTGEYVVYWASMTNVDGKSYQVMYYAKTRDFVTFTEPQEYIDRGKQEEYAGYSNPHCIDLSMIKTDDGYYRVSADGRITIEKSDSVLGEWKIISTLEALSDGMAGYDTFYSETGIKLTGGVVEGPELFKFNGEDRWGLYSDNYGKIGYIPVTTTDLSDTTGTAWRAYSRSEYNFGNVLKRHGCITPITQSEYDAIMAKWDGGTAEEKTEGKQTKPILEYDFEETAADKVIADASRNGNEGILHGNAKYVEDEEMGNVLYLDGTSGTYAELTEGLFDGRRSVTISMDVKAVTTSGNYFTFTLGKNKKKYMFLKTGDTSTRFSINKGAGEQTVSADTSSNNGKWVNVKMVVDGSAIALYLDYEKVDEKTDATIFTTDMGRQIFSYLGKSFYPADAYFNGYLDNVRVYNYAMTEAEVTAEGAEEMPLLSAVTSEDVNIVNSVINRNTGKITLYATNFAYDLASMTSKKADLKNISLDLTLAEGATADLADTCDLTKDLTVKVTKDGRAEEYTISTILCNNPVLGGEFADPDIDAFNGKYYLYCTTDGYAGWGGWQFHVFESEDLTNWTDKGIILDLKKDVKWSDGNAWAPTIEEKNGKYYFYFCGNEATTNKKAIGVAVSDSPTGSFVAADEPVVNMSLCGSEGISMGQAIDPSIFTEDDGTSYMLFGNGKPAVVELADDMVSVVPGTMKNYSGATDFREAITVNKVDNKYHFTWSCDDTGSENYHVNYGVSDSLYGPIQYKYVLWQKDLANNIKGPAHHSVLQVPGTKDFYIAYHRFLTPLGQITGGYGYHRETCIDKLIYNEETQLFEAGTPTLEGITKGQTYTQQEVVRHKVIYKAGEGGSVQGKTVQSIKTGGSGTMVTAVPKMGYKFKRWSDGSTDVQKIAGNVTGDMTYTAEFEPLSKEDLAVYEKHLIGHLSFDSKEEGFGAGGAAGTENGTTNLTEDAHLGKALSLSGAGYVDIKKTDGSSLLTGLNEFTISYYSKVNGTGTNWSVFAAPDTTAQTYNKEMYLGALDRSNGLIVERYKNNGSRPASVQASETNTEWKHVVIVVEEEQTTLYIDGIKKDTVSSSFHVSDMLGENSILQIGKGNWGSGEYMTGLIDEFKVYDCALTYEQVISEAVTEIKSGTDGKNDGNDDKNTEKGDGENTGTDGKENGNGNTVVTPTTAPTKESIISDNPGLPSGTAEESSKAVFGKLKAMVKTSNAKSNKLRWSKVTNADGYVVFGSKCNTKGKKYAFEVLAIIDKNNITSYTHKGLDKNTYYKYIVQAYRMVNGQAQIVSTSKTIHAATTGSKYANVKSVKVKRSKVTLDRKGKKYTLKVTQKKTGGKKLQIHRKVTFETSNKRIATVNKKGVITAKKKGTCTICVYAQNGVYTKVTVKVKK